MKKTIFTLATVALLVSCNGNKNEADAFGNFESDEVIVSAENNGKIMQTNAEEGDLVKAGSVLVITDTVNLSLQRTQLAAQKSSTEAQKSNIQAQMAVSEQQIKNLNKDLVRIQKMLVDGAATQKQLDDIEGAIALANKQKNAYSAQLGAIQKQADAVQAQIGVQEDKIKSSVVAAPLDATVLEKYIETGELATPGKALYKLADLQTLTLRVYISETQLPQIKVGQQVKVYIDYGKEQKEMQGNISWIASQAEFTPKIIQTKEERVKLVYAVKVRVKNDGSLKIGMPGEIKFN
jgi:HlyD family secretion protein